MKERFAIIASFAIAIAAPIATAQEQGVTSGPSTGNPVEPSGAVQKENPNIPEVDQHNPSTPSGASAGAPGVEGKKGTQSGKWVPPEEIRRR